MPIKNIRFGTRQRPSPEAWDIHLLRGQSTLSLRDRLQVLDELDNEWKSLGDYFALNDDIEVEFRPVFNATEHASEFRGLGITVAKVSGEITTAAGAITHQPRNFIVEAVVSDEEPKEIDKAIIRIHLHNSVEKIWLTPKTLTIRRPADPTPGESYDPNTRYSFTVRARFDDGIVGDVTFALELGLWGPDATEWPEPICGHFRKRTPAGGPRLLVADALQRPAPVQSQPAQALLAWHEEQDATKQRRRFAHSLCGGTSPDKEKEANWLPAPSGTFSLFMRAYWAEKVMLDGTWKPPTIDKVAN